MTTTKGFTDELQILANYGAIGSKLNDLLPTLLDKVNLHTNFPLRMFATFPTPDAVLNFAPNKVTVGDGSISSVPPANSTLPDHSGGTVNLQTGALTGGTIQTNGGAFTLPTPTASNRFFRMACVYNAATNAIDTNFSAEAATEGALPDPGPLYDVIEGFPMGFVDLESTNGTNPEFKTAASLTNIIENAKIVKFGAAGGGGGGAGTADSAGIWSPASGQEPIEDNENGAKVFLFDPSLGQKLVMFLKAPSGRTVTTRQILAKLNIYSPSTSNNVFLRSTTYLIRPDTEAVSSTANSHVSTNSALTNASPANVLREVELDLTDANGEINSIPVEAGHMLRIELERVSDTDTAEVRVIANSSIIKF